MLLHLVTSRPQINLDLTDWVSDNDAIQHDCLHVTVPTASLTNFQQIISYCMNEWPSKWTIDQNNFDRKFTFAELVKLDTTSEQLYIWSAPIDVIESYQLYLNERLISKEISSMANESFYNCTPSTFGPLCQYSLDIYDPNHSSLQDIFHDYYTYPYEPITLTCYTHIQCMHGTYSVCLDWRSICDKQMDCFDGIDEKYCWELEINQCKDDEYRCDYDQCMPKTFLLEVDSNVDCIAGFKFSPHISIPPRPDRMEPTFASEDSRCGRHAHGDLPSQGLCAKERTTHNIEAMFSDKSKNISDDCWFAFRCYFNIPNSSQPRCRNYCTRETCRNLINNTCPDMLFIPNIPIHFGHIYLAYTKKAALQVPNSILRPSYICYNDQLCSQFLPNKTLLSFNNVTCRRPEDFPVKFYPGGRGVWISTYVKPLYDQLYKCNTISQVIAAAAAACNSSHMYQCKNSFKCISINRVGDNHIDCDYEDDEEEDVIARACLNDESGNFFNCPTTKKCINRKKYADNICECESNEYGTCADEPLHMHDIRTHISFTSICDGFTELIPVNISGRYESDETECELWQCNNTYTRCDGFWNCPNGADEVDCDPSPLINCPLQHTVECKKNCRLAY